MSIRHALVTVVGATLLATGVGGFLAAPASASDRPALLPPDPACTDGNGSVCLYYHGDGTGARVELFGDIACYDNCGGTQYVFNNTADGTAGLGDQVRNAAAYAYNNNSSLMVVIYYHPNYQGVFDNLTPDGVVGWDMTWFGELDKTWNDNASQQFVSYS